MMGLLTSISLHAQKKPKKELYVPMDYSTCGYHASESAIPDVDVSVYVAWQDGDCSRLIQAAIDQVCKQKANAAGQRGAVLLGEGTFRIDHPLRISQSGIVLRGMGRGKTVLSKAGCDRGAAIYLEGAQSTISSPDTLFLAGECVMAGSTTLRLATGDGTPLQVGDRIDIVRPSTKSWISHLQMEDFGGGLDYTGWKPTDIDITWDRTVTAVNADQIHIDAPVTTTLDPVFGISYILRSRHIGEVTECGIENLTIEAAVSGSNVKDEDHCWDGIFMENARDCWVRQTNFSHLAGSAVNLQKHTSRITVEDCVASDPVSETGGWRRCVYLTRGQQTLVQRCVSRQGMHDFAAGYCAAGPNAFVQCEGEESLGFSGSIGSWAAGLLFDIVNIDGSDLRFANLEQFQFGTGWNTANSMLWQCTASTLYCYSPDEDNRNSAHGCWGTLVGNGEWTSSNDHVNPRSLFYDQLERRLLGQRTDTAGVRRFVAERGRILPRSLDASTSPTVEQAMALAQESLTTPRLTLETWIDSIPFTASTLAGKAFRYQEKEARQPSVHISVENGHLVSGGQLITGNQYDIPWWSGRVKDNFAAHGARPAITRFVPGREGTGWTDRIDSVVNYLDQNHFAMLHHHYGLWYDLRRTDHERVRRADGDVWAPFYEQPFARSGKGTAWDGLSLYDLSQPNKWYWSRLNQFASQAAPKGILLFNEHYFQHNILEAGAHWVDCPWRPVNNINGTNFPEPVPFAGDKRIFMAEQFYDETDETLRPLHRQHIRMCLEEMSGQPNVVHSLSAEYTGPLHFTRFWLQTIAEWEKETGKHPLIALSCTKDAQDSIMADPVLSQVVDIIDIRYWHLNTEGLWAPDAGRNMAPRQWMRKVKVGKTGFMEVYRAVRECHDRYPGKAITYYSQQYPAYGWAVAMGGGSIPNIPIQAAHGSSLQQTLLNDMGAMQPFDSKGCLSTGDGSHGYVVYTLGDSACEVNVAAGQYDIHTVDASTGAITLLRKNQRLEGSFTPPETASDKVFWLKPRR